MENKLLSRAIHLLYKHHCYYLNYRFAKPIRMDMRYNFSKLVKKIEPEIKSKIDFDLIKKKKTERRERNNFKFENILDNKILKDFLKNRNGMQIHEDRLHVTGRNHWAKNEQDFKVLEVLRKHKKKI